MRLRLLITISAAALIGLASAGLSQERPERRGPPGGFGGGGGMMMMGGGGGFVNRLFLLRIPMIQKELELVDEQLTAIQKLQEEMGRGRGGPGGPGGGDEQRGRGRGRPEGKGDGNRPDNGAALQRVPADWYFVQAQEQDQQRRRPGGGGQPPTEEERRQMEQQRMERARQEKAKLTEILLPHQMKRLTEIYVQVAGVAALQDEDIAKELGITDAQQGAIASIRDANREAMRGLFGPPGGGGQPREGDREAFAARMREAQTKMDEARKAGDAKILAVLTAEQKAKFEEMKGAKFDLPEEALRAGFGGPGGVGRGPGGPGGPGDGKRGPRGGTNPNPN